MNEKRFARMAREKLRLKMRSREGTVGLLLASPCWLEGAGCATAAGQTSVYRGGYRGDVPTLARAYSCPTMSTEISIAGIVPLFSSQCVVSLSSGQPTPGP